MSSPSSHIIRKQVIELDVPQGTATAAMQDKAANLCRDLWPQLGALLDRYEATGLTFSFDTIDLDLGEFDAPQMTADFGPRLLSKLETVLEKSLQQPPEATLRAGTGTANTSLRLQLPKALRPSTPSVQAYRVSGDPVAFFEHFIQTGQKPWWGEVVAMPAPKEWIETVVKGMSTEQARQWWDRWAGNSKAIQRLWKQFPQSEVLTLLERISGRPTQTWQAEVEALDRLNQAQPTEQKNTQKPNQGYPLRGIYLQLSPNTLATLSAPQIIRGWQQHHAMATPQEATIQLAEALHASPVSADSPLQTWGRLLSQAPETAKPSGKLADRKESDQSNRTPQIDPTPTQQDAAAAPTETNDSESNAQTTIPTHKVADRKESDRSNHNPQIGPISTHQDAAAARTESKSNDRESNAQTTIPTHKVADREGADRSNRNPQIGPTPTHQDAAAALTESKSNDTESNTETATPTDKVADREGADRSSRNPQIGPTPTHQDAASALTESKSNDREPNAQTTTPTDKVADREGADRSSRNPQIGPTPTRHDAASAPSSAEELAAMIRQEKATQDLEPAESKSNDRESNTETAAPAEKVADREGADRSSRNPQIGPTPAHQDAAAHSSTKEPTEPRPTPIQNRQSLDPSDPEWRARWARFWASQERGASQPEEKTPGPLWRKNQGPQVDGEWYIDNGGLVLLWPFLARFLGALELVADGVFIDEAATERAVHILQYLVTAEEATPEHELALNKLLCGLPMDYPLTAGITLTDSEVEECEGLLSAAAKNWAALKNTSGEGFRKSFLSREAKLSLEDGLWRLTVAPAGLDVLQNTRPWPVSVIKLPWMEESLYVEW